MKLNIECVRDIMLTIEESLEFGDSWTIDDLRNHLPTYSASELEYTCLKLAEAKYINAHIPQIGGIGSEFISTICSLTYAGHEFLESIRPETTWGTVKNVVSKLGTSSIHAVSQIASTVITELIRSYISDGKI